MRDPLKFFSDEDCDTAIHGLLFIEIDRANALIREAPLEVVSHGYRFRLLRNGNLWVEGPDGDGMELKKASLDKIWREYM